MSLRTLRDVVRGARGQPSLEEDARAREMVRSLRRCPALADPPQAETVEANVRSLRTAKEAAELTLANLDHAGLRAAVGGVLDALREILDRWSQGAAGRLPRDFFEELRSTRSTVVGLIELIVPHGEMPR